ncbi:MAG: hydrolase [bacterium]
MADNNTAETGCCSRLDPSLWDEREFTWQDKPFLRERVISFLHMPLNMGAAFRRGFAQLERAGAMPVQPFWLSDERSAWGADLLLEMDGRVEGVEPVRLSGQFVSKVFSGPYSQIRNWIGEMEKFAAGRNRKIDKLYFHYAYCPKCAKQYGQNYVVLIARVS